MAYFRPVTTIPPDTTPNISESAYRSGYSQALEDYAVADILKAVQQTQPDISAAESGLIAALLIEQLPKAINPELVSRYLYAVRDRQQQNLFAVPIALEYPQSTKFPNLLNLPVPRYAIGVKVRLSAVLGAAEWGTLIGFYWCYAPHRCQWMYRYILYLDRDSPSAAWIKSTFAWENEIECQLGETS